MSSPPKSGPRRRLSAEESRERILVAAERRLAEVGPEGLRLTELAAELGISHPAILHHFGSREGLVAAVVRRATRTLNRQLTDLLSQRGGRRAILDAVAEFLSERGHARLLAWLILSGRTQRPQSPSQQPAPLRPLVELAHQQRTQSEGGHGADFADTSFRSQLTALALLGDAVFGDTIRLALGDQTGPEAASEFRKRLAALMKETS